MEDQKNQFTVLNSLWFAVGSLMQQGSDVIPRAAATRIVAVVWYYSYYSILYLFIENSYLTFYDFVYFLIKYGYVNQQRNSISFIFFFF